MHILKVQIENEDQYKVVSQERTKALIQNKNYCRIQWITSVHMFINAKLCFTPFSYWELIYKDDWQDKIHLTCGSDKQ